MNLLTFYSIIHFKTVSFNKKIGLAIIISVISANGKQLSKTCTPCFVVSEVIIKAFSWFLVIQISIIAHQTLVGFAHFSFCGCINILTCLILTAHCPSEFHFPHRVTTSRPVAVSGKYTRLKLAFGQTALSALCNSSQLSVLMILGPTELPLPLKT